MGFDKRGLVAVRLSNTAARSYDVLRDRLLSDPRILDVTGAEGRLVNVSRMGWSREFKGRQVSFQAYIVKWNFLRMMGIPVTDGRDFLDSDDRKPVGSLICNEAARREFDLHLGDPIGGFCDDDPIVGFCADFNFKPLQYGVAPFVFYVLPEEMSQLSGRT